MLFQDAMARGLADHGIDTVFGLIGDANLFVMDSFRMLPGTRYVGVAHEAAAVEAASGYAQVTRRLGVASVTHGPALTNTVTALADAVRGRIPILLVAGDTRPDDRFHVQSIPQRDVVLATGAGFEQLRSPSTIADDLGSAVRRAHAERRPVVLNMSAGFQWSEVGEAASTIRPHALGRPRPAEEDLDRALGIIASARRPVVLAGRGTIDREARTAVLRFANRIGAPLTTTLKARDLFRGEPHDLGICGTVAHDLALATIDGADCVVVFGAGLNQHTTADGWLADGRRVVQVDDDPRALGRYVAPDAGVLADAGSAAAMFHALLDGAGVTSSGYASAELAADLAARLADRDRRPDQSEAGSVDIHTAVHLVDAAVPADRTVVTDSGRFVFSAWPVIGVQDPRHFVHTASFGSIGLGMGTAIGAAVARPDHPTLLVTGDGGFMLHGLNELTTAVRHGLDLVVLLLNDGAYGAEHVQFVRRDMDPAMSMLAWPDFGPVADALGARGFTARSTAELEAALAHLPRRDRPVLIDVHLDPAQVPAAH